MATDGGTSAAEGAPAPTPEDASGYGLAITLIGAVLLALAYYGAVAIEGIHQLGGALPEPFYYLAFAALFVLELLGGRGLSVVGFARAVAFAVIYGVLVVFAVEGGAYLRENPGAALEGYVGVTVLAVALVVSALSYVVYLAILES